MFFQLDDCQSVRVKPLIAGILRYIIQIFPSQECLLLIIIILHLQSSPAPANHRDMTPHNFRHKSTSRTTTDCQCHVLRLKSLIIDLNRAFLFIIQDFSFNWDYVQACFFALTILTTIVTFECYRNRYDGHGY